MTITETMPASYWCGKLSQTLREIAETDEVTPRLTVKSIKGKAERMLEQYDRESGFPPPDAQIRAHVGEDMPLDFLKPGERLINGTIYYSARWLDEGVKEVPGAYRYVIFLNEAKTKMLTCWPQEDENVWKLETASRPWTAGTWGPPDYEEFRGDVTQLERFARGRDMPVKELAL